MKKLVNVLVGAVLLPVGAQAFPIFDAIQSKLPVQKTAQRETCTNFSGTWKGSCVIDGKSTPQSTTISQSGCEILVVDGNGMSVGGLANATIMAPLAENVVLGVSMGTSANWNEDHTAIHAAYTGHIQVPSHGGATLAGTSTLQMNGDRLAFDASILGVSLSCVYDKQ